MQTFGEVVLVYALWYVVDWFLLVNYQDHRSYIYSCF